MVSILFIALLLCCIFKIALMKWMRTKMCSIINRICIKNHDCVRIAIRKKWKKKWHPSDGKEDSLDYIKSKNHTMLPLQRIKITQKKCGKTFTKMYIWCFPHKIQLQHYNYVTNNLIRSSWLARCHVRLFRCSMFALQIPDNFHTKIRIH